MCGVCVICFCFLKPLYQWLGVTDYKSTFTGNHQYAIDLKVTASLMYWVVHFILLNKAMYGIY